jgi:hypothetical protein
MRQAVSGKFKLVAGLSKNFDHHLLFWAPGGSVAPQPPPSAPTAARAAGGTSSFEIQDRPRYANEVRVQRFLNAIAVARQTPPTARS